MSKQRKIKFNFEGANFESLEDIRKRNEETVKQQLKAQEPFNPDDYALTPQQKIGKAVVEAIAEPFKTIDKGLRQLGGVNPIDNPVTNIGKVMEKGITGEANPIAGAINLATGIAEIPMLIGTVPLNVMNEGLNQVGLNVIGEGVNKVFETIGEAPTNVANEISEALEKHGTATKIRNFVDNVVGEQVRIDPQTGQEIKEATSQAMGLASIIGLMSLAHGTYSNLKNNVKVQAELKNKGYSAEEISKMKPEEAFTLLEKETQKEIATQVEKEVKLREEVDRKVKESIPEEPLGKIEKRVSKSGKEYYYDTETKKFSNKQKFDEQQKVEPKPELPKEEVKTVEEVKPIEEVKTKVEEVEPEVKPTEVINEVKKAEQELIKSPESPEVVGITKQQMNETRQKIGLPELEKVASQEIPETFGRVKTEIESGVRTPETLLNSLTTEKKLDPTQRFEGLYYLTKENNRWNVIHEKMKEARTSGDKALETSLNFMAEESVKTMRDLTNALSEASSEWGRFGRFTQELLAQDYTPARIFQRAEMKAPEGNIPTSVKTRLENFASELSKVQKSYETLKGKGVVNTIEDFISRAEREAKFQERRTQRTTTKQDLKVQREQLWVDLYKATSVQASGIPLTPEAIKVMGRLAKNYVQEGIVTVEGLVDQFYTGFKGQVSKEEIMRALSGYGQQTKPRTKDEITTTLKSAKQEMRLLLAIEDAKKGEQLPKGKRTPPPEKIQNLQRMLKAVTKENIDLSDAQKLQAQKTRVKNRIAEFERKLKTKDYAKPEKRTVIPDKELIELKTKETQLKKQIELELYRLERMNMTKWDKTKEIGGEIINIPRTALATADLSMPLRQALPATVSEPLLAYQAFKIMHKAGVSEKYFNELMSSIETSKNARAYEKMQIDFTGVGSDLVKLAKREENFIASHVLNKIPGVGSITKFSERGAVAYLNSLRQLMADKQIDYLMNKGLTPENALKTYQDVGKVINWSTGRASLGTFEKMPGLMTGILFSPRNMVAKWQYYDVTNYFRLAPEAKKLFFKQQLATLAQGIMFLNMARLAGAEVETDPRSSDFAKAKFGNTRIDMFGGFQQNFVLLARMAYGLPQLVGQETENFKTTSTGGLKDEKVGKIMLDYFRNKLSPPAAIGVDALFGKRFRTGNESFGNELKDRFMPLVWQDMVEQIEELGWGAFGTTLLGFYGAGTQTFEAKSGQNFNIDNLDKKMKFNFDVNFNF